MTNFICLCILAEFKRRRRDSMSNHCKDEGRGFGTPQLPLLWGQSLGFHCAKRKKTEQNPYHKWTEHDNASRLNLSTIVTIENWRLVTEIEQRYLHSFKKFQSARLGCQTLLWKVLSIIKLTQVPHPAVTQNSYNRVSWTHRLCHPYSSNTVHGWRTTNKEAIIFQEKPGKG